MTIANPVREIAFQGVRMRFESERGFEEVVDALLADVGRTPVAINEFGARFDTWEAYRQAVEPLAGPGGFMLFASVDHGTWIPKAGIDRKALRLVIGNPLIAITMIRHDVTAGLFVPVELLVTDEPGGSAVTYLLPSSLMVVESNAPLLAAAQELDAKLAALIARVTGAA